MLFQLSASVSQIGFGHLADRWRPRLLLLTGPIVSVAVLSFVGAANVIRTGKPEIYPEIPEEMLVEAAQDEEHLRMLRKLAPKIRHFLGKRLKLKYTPELDFRYDETAMKALRVETLLRDVIPPNPENEHLGSDEEEE